MLLSAAKNLEMALVSHLSQRVMNPPSRASRIGLVALTCLLASGLLAVAAGATGVVSGVLRQNTQGSVRIVFKNEGDTTIAAFRQVLPDPFIVTGAQLNGATCTVLGKHEYACGGFTAAPGSTWSVVFTVPKVYSDLTGTDVYYYPGAGPSTFFVSDATGTEAGPFVAEWNVDDVKQEPYVGLAIVRFVASPIRPAAGKRFTVGLQLSTSDLAALASGRVKCTAKIGTRPSARSARNLALCESPVCLGAPARDGGPAPVRSGRGTPSTCHRRQIVRSADSVARRK
ncbi:MAG: hypothetical protein H0U03_13445 [Actinobacteria bacterium]|nr:hypothetical protein [Actinomycetota bacterium]